MAKEFVRFSSHVYQLLALIEYADKCAVQLNVQDEIALGQAMDLDPATLVVPINPKTLGLPIAESVQDLALLANLSDLVYKNQRGLSNLQDCWSKVNLMIQFPYPRKTDLDSVTAAL